MEQGILRGIVALQDFEIIVKITVLQTTKLNLLFHNGVAKKFTESIQVEISIQL